MHSKCPAFAQPRRFCYDDIGVCRTAKHFELFLKGCRVALAALFFRRMLKM